jgi:thiol-disulfide isomerase/thioredoxin
MDILGSVFGKEDLVGMKAPELPEGAGPWINSEPLTLRQLQKEKQIVMLDFWTYSCVNCLRTLKYLKLWHERYYGSGLTIVGVHTPEFEFEKNHKNVLEFVEREAITYPVVLDSDYRIWNAYANRYWPRKFLIDTKGRIRYDHAGEGAYIETEEQIRGLLAEAKKNQTLPAFKTTTHEHVGKGSVCYPLTPETYCGYSRGRLGNAEGYIRERFHVYKVSKSEKFIDGFVYLVGGWVAKPDYLQHGTNLKQALDYLLLPYHGLELNAVLKIDETKRVLTAQAYVYRDNRPIDKDIAGEDVLFDKEGRSYLNILEPRMYNIIADKEFGEHTLKLIPFSDNLQVYAFTFGGCAN